MWSYLGETRQHAKPLEKPSVSIKSHRSKCIPLLELNRPIVWTNSPLKPLSKIRSTPSCTSLLKVCCRINQFIFGTNWPTLYLHFLHWHSEMDQRITIMMGATVAIISLHLIEIWWAYIRPVTTEFTRLKYVGLQRASISTRVSLTVFIRGSGNARKCGNQYSVMFHCYSLQDDTAMLGGLHSSLCHAVTSFLFSLILIRPPIGLYIDYRITGMKE